MPATGRCYAQWAPFFSGARSPEAEDFGAGQAEAARQLGAAKDMALRRSQRTRQQLGERLRPAAVASPQPAPPPPA